jgi:Ca-activated chloride channel family protein
VNSPVLSDIELTLGDVDADLIYPRKLPDLFKGMQLTLIGRYRNTNDLRNIAIALKGRTGREARSFSFTGLNFPLRGEDNSFLPRLWASRRVGWLIEQIRANGENKELRDEVVDLGTRYGIVTPYTSYLATDGTLANAPRDSDLQRAAAKSAPSALREAQGAGAVRQSLRQNAMQANTVATADAEERKDQVLIRNSVQNQFVGNKNFFRQAEQWVDADFMPGRNLPETVVKFASDDYYALAVREPGLARFLALGEEVVVVWNGRVYKVVK